jgi:PAS domain S-box-containing protein
MIRVFHVDDNPDDAEITKINLVRVNKELAVRWLCDARDALDALELDRCDCIVCDYQMPGMNGLEFLQKLRDRNDVTPFIFLTGQGNEELAAQALRRGADDYYSKDVGPLHYERLARSIERIVELSREKERRNEVQRRIYQMAETAADMILTIDMKGIITYVNKSTLEHLKLKESELVGKGIFEAFPSFDQGAAARKEYIGRLLNGEVVSSESQVITGDDKTLVVDARATLMLDKGKPYEILLIVRDQTEQVRILEELKASEEKFRKFFQLAPEAYYIRKMSGEFIDLNEEALKLTGYSRDELVGTNIRDVKLLAKDEEEEILNFSESKKSDGGVQDFNITIINKLNQRFSAEIRSVATELNGEKVILGMIRRIEKAER